MIWLWLYLTIPSLGIMHKFTGWRGLALYLVIVAAALWIAQRFKISERISETQARWLAWIALAAIGAAFVAIYPIAQSLTYGGGSDSDDSVNAGVTELLHGRYPYYATTYLGNFVHEMPGLLILSTPFVLMGNSAYINLFLLGAFLWAMVGESGGLRPASLGFAAMLGPCPAVMHAVVTGSSQLSNALLVAIALYCVLRATSTGTSIFASIFLGFALSSRANFLMVIPTAFLYLGRNHGWKRAIRDMGIASLTFLAVTLPFYLRDPENFTPLEGSDRLTRLDAVLPHLGIAAGVAALCFAAWLGWRSDLIMPSCALVQAFLVLVVALLTRNIDFTSYGVFFLPFAMLYPWKVFAPKST